MSTKYILHLYSILRFTSVHYLLFYGTSFWKTGCIVFYDILHCLWAVVSAFTYIKWTLYRIVRINVLHYFSQVSALFFNTGCIVYGMFFTMTHTVTCNSSDIILHIYSETYQLRNAGDYAAYYICYKLLASHWQKLCTGHCQILQTVHRHIDLDKIPYTSIKLL